jgi:hypothetical protein
LTEGMRFLNPKQGHAVDSSVRVESRERRIGTQRRDSVNYYQSEVEMSRIVRVGAE